MAKKKWTKKRLSLLVSIIAFLASQLIVMVVPYGQVPDQYKFIYDAVLKYRNKVINRLDLPVDLYSTQKTVELEGGKVNILFAPSSTISKELVSFIDSAESSIAVCVFELNLPEVADALILKYQQGVDVKVILDTDYKNEKEVYLLAEAGVPVRYDQRRAFMHNKFVVVDEKKVWTGSYNFTHNGSYRNDNNVITLQSSKLAENYLKEFSEMWTSNKGLFGSQGFGPKSSASTPYPRIEFGDFELENYFAPEDQVQPKILRELYAAEKNIHILAFSFTSDPIESLLKRKIIEGVAVKAVFHGSGANTEYSAYEGLKKAGADCQISFNTRGVMHHKVIIIDSKVVITGSYNFSRNANENNDENILIIRSPHIARIYEEEFLRCIRGVKGY